MGLRGSQSDLRTHRSASAPRPVRPAASVLLAVDQASAKGAPLRIAPELADPVGSSKWVCIRTWRSSAREPPEGVETPRSVPPGYRSQLGTHGQSYAAKPTASLASGAAPVWLGCLSSTARADFPSIT
jgi:hypothetical protein